MTVDLHCHTKISDNTMTIPEVIRLAKMNGVTHLAITDHDTTKGLEEAIETGKEAGVEIIPGIEISAFDFKRNRRAHILGFYIEPGHPAISELCDPLIKTRHEASKKMVEKIIAAGYGITWEKVKEYTEGGTGVYKQHIMHALIDAGYELNIYGPLYKKLFSRGDKEHEPGIAFVPIRYIDVLDAIAAIKKAGGIPVIAHPGQMDNFDAIPEWSEAGLEGIEVYHPDHSEEDIVRCKELAEKYDLVMTGGSDFHGFYGDPRNTVGLQSPGNDSVAELKKRVKTRKINI